MFRINHSVTLISLLLIATSALAHHGYGGRYDQTTVAELEGELVRKLWRNPHIRLTIKDAAGELWELEGATASVVIKSGLTEDLVNLGDQLLVAGYPSAAGLNEMILRNILLPSGKEVVMSSRGSPRWQTDNYITGERPPIATVGDKSAPELGIFRTWVTVTTDPDSKGIFPEAANADLVWRYPLTADATEAVKAFDPATENPLQDNCLGKGMPMIMDQPWGMQFTQQGESIVVHMEEFDSVRTIHMTDQVQAPLKGSKFGFSTGHWDGDTLVVETSHVDWPLFTQMGVPQNESTVFMERFTPVEQGSRLDYQLVATDLKVFTEPVTLKKYWIWDPKAKIEAYDCVE